MYDVFGTIRLLEYEIVWITDENTKRKLQGKVKKLRVLAIIQDITEKK